MIFRIQGWKIFFSLEFRTGSWKVCIGGDIDDKYEG